MRSTKVMNFSGKMSILGVTKIHEDVLKAYTDAAKAFYLISDFIKEGEKLIADKFGAETAYITASASAGIVSSILAIRSKLKASGENRLVNVLLPVGHDINYGAPIREMLELGGANVIDIGTKESLTNDDMKSSLSFKPDVAFFVSSHYCTKSQHPEVQEYVDFYQSSGIIVAMDVAAEEDVWKFAKTGADYTVVSGSKAISAPTSGFILTKEKYIRDLEALRYSYGRSMKVSKETIAGLVKAVEIYSRTPIKTESEDKIDILIEQFNTQIEQDLRAAKSTDTSRGIDRIRISSTPKDILELVNTLKKNNIYTREYGKNEGYIELDLRQASIEEYNQLLKVVERRKDD